MSDARQGRCHYCKAVHQVIEATKEQATFIAEDAQSEEDYYFMPEHIDEKTGKKCRGVGRPPESFFPEEQGDLGYDGGGALMPGEVEDKPGDNGNYLEPGDIIDKGKVAQENIRNFLDGPLDALDECDP